jgi:hypothetical protein
MKYETERWDNFRSTRRTSASYYLIQVTEVLLQELLQLPGVAAQAYNPKYWGGGTTVAWEICPAKR